MRGVEAMVIAYLRDNPKSNRSQISAGTGCTPVTVRDALRRLKKDGKVSGERIGVRNCLAYSLKRNVDLTELCEIDVCGKHYALTGAQIQKLRHMADEYDAENRRDGV